MIIKLMDPQNPIVPPGSTIITPPPDQSSNSEKRIFIPKKIIIFVVLILILIGGSTYFIADLNSKPTKISNLNSNTTTQSNTILEAQVSKTDQIPKIAITKPKKINGRESKELILIDETGKTLRTLSGPNELVGTSNSLIPPDKDNILYLSLATSSANPKASKETITLVDKNGRRKTVGTYEVYDRYLNNAESLRGVEPIAWCNDSRNIIIKEYYSFISGEPGKNVTSRSRNIYKILDTNSGKSQTFKELSSSYTAGLNDSSPQLSGDDLLNFSPFGCDVNKSLIYVFLGLEESDAPKIEVFNFKGEKVNTLDGGWKNKRRHKYFPQESFLSVETEERLYLHKVAEGLQEIFSIPTNIRDARDILTKDNIVGINGKDVYIITERWGGGPGTSGIKAIEARISFDLEKLNVKNRKGTLIFTNRKENFIIMDISKDGRYIIASTSEYGKWEYKLSIFDTKTSKMTDIPGFSGNAGNIPDLIAFME